MEYVHRTIKNYSYDVVPYKFHYEDDDYTYDFDYEFARNSINNPTVIRFELEQNDTEIPSIVQHKMEFSEVRYVLISLMKQ